MKRPLEWLSISRMSDASDIVAQRKRFNATIHARSRSAPRATDLRVVWTSTWSWNTPSITKPSYKLRMQLNTWCQACLVSPAAKRSWASQPWASQATSSRRVVQAWPLQLHPLPTRSRKRWPLHSSQVKVNRVRTTTIITRLMRKQLINRNRWVAAPQASRREVAAGPQLSRQQQRNNQASKPQVSEGWQASSTISHVSYHPLKNIRISPT